MTKKNEKDDTRKIFKPRHGKAKSSGSTGSLVDRQKEEADSNQQQSKKKDEGV